MDYIIATHIFVAGSNTAAIIWKINLLIAHLG